MQKPLTLLKCFRVRLVDAGHKRGTIRATLATSTFDGLPSVRPSTISFSGCRHVGLDAIREAGIRGSFFHSKQATWCAETALPLPERLYCNGSTPAVSSSNPLGQTTHPLNVLGAGWEPRGDNGLAKGAVCELPSPRAQRSRFRDCAR